MSASIPCTIQSISKAFVYGYTLAEYGREYVLSRIGVEPTGEAFNSIVLDEVHNRPFNPMVNAGAMAAAELIKGETPEARIATMLSVLSRFAGRSLLVDDDVHRSEQATGHRNRRRHPDAHDGMLFADELHGGIILTSSENSHRSVQPWIRSVRVGSDRFESGTVPCRTVSM